MLETKRHIMSKSAFEASKVTGLTHSLNAVDYYSFFPVPLEGLPV